MSVELISLFISAFISSTIAPGGSEVVLAYWVSQDRYPVSELLGIATLGNTLGAITTWYLGVFAAKKWSPNTLVSAKNQRALTLLEKHGVWLLLFSWLPLIGDALCFAGGWLKLPFALACLLIAVGKLARYALIAGVFA